MRGKIIYFDPNHQAGYIHGEDGYRYEFRVADFATPAITELNTEVDYRPEGPNAKDLKVIPAAGFGQPSPAAAGGNQWGQQPNQPAGQQQNPFGQPAQPGQQPNPFGQPAQAGQPANPFGQPAQPGYGQGYNPGMQGGMTQGAWQYPPEVAKRGLFENFKLVMTKRYADFQGRAGRREYWSFALFYLIAIVGAVIVASVLGALTGDEDTAIGIIAVMSIIAMLAFIVPSIALLVRRLHDLGFSGWMALCGFIPYVGSIVLLVFALMPTKTEPNKYGPAPK